MCTQSCLCLAQFAEPDPCVAQEEEEQEQQEQQQEEQQQEQEQQQQEQPDMSKTEVLDPDPVEPKIQASGEILTCLDL